VDGLDMVDISALECDRSFLGLQRYVKNVTVEGADVLLSEVALDAEPTGTPLDCTPVIDNVRVSNSNLGGKVHLAGLGCKTVNNIVIEDTIIGEGGVTLYDASNVTLRKLHLRNSGSAPALYIAKRAVGIRVVDTVLERVTGSGQGNTVKVVGANGANPTDVTLVFVRVIHNTDGGPIYAESLGSLVVVGSRVEYAGAPTASYAITSKGVDAPAGAPVVVDSVVTGSLGGIARLTGLTDGGSPAVVRSRME
jgi:hypothetical protein